MKDYRVSRNFIDIMLVLAIVTCSMGWLKSYSSDNSFTPNAGWETESGEYIFALSTMDEITYVTEILRLDENGDFISKEALTEDIRLGSMVPSGDGNYLVVGESQAATGYGDGALLKINEDADILWSRFYPPITDEFRFRFITQTHDSCYLIAGYAITGRGYENFPLIQKVTPDGEIIWQNELDLEEVIPLWDFCELNPEGDMAFLGNYQVDVMEEHNQIYFISADFSEINMICDDDRSPDIGDTVMQCICPTYDGNILSAGSIFTSDSNDILFLREYRSGGTILRELNVDESRLYSPHAIIRDTRDSTYLVAGLKAIRIEYDHLYYWWMKFDKELNLVWERDIEQTDFHGLLDDIRFVSLTSDGGYLFSIMHYFNDDISWGRQGLIAIKTDSLGYYATIEESYPPKPAALSLSVYPNPFNSTLDIETMPNSQVEIFNLQGRKITEITANQSGVCAWSPVKGVGSGLYFISARLGDTSIQSRCLYLK